MLHLADCFLFPSYEETEGIVVLEALATRCPTIVRNIGALSYLENGRDAIMCNNNLEFIEAIKKVLNSDNKEMVDNGYKLANDRDLINVGALLKHYYEELLNKNK